MPLTGADFQAAQSKFVQSVERLRPFGVGCPGAVQRRTSQVIAKR